MKTLIRILQAISTLIGIALIILFLIPAICGIKPFVVLSGSMEPQIKTGAVAYVNTYIRVDAINVGDIIAFSVGDEQVTHRVIQINEDNTFTTKGDANNTEDLAPVSFESYKGKTIFSIPYLGKVMSLFQTSTGRFIVFLIIGLNIVCIIFSGDEKEGEDTDGKDTKK